MEKALRRGILQDLRKRESIISVTSIQISKGNTCIWSTPWCPFWKEIHECLNIQETGFKYPATISDLWFPNSKNWNTTLLTTLFGADKSNILSNLPVGLDNNDGMLIWKFTPSGICTSKRAYHLFHPAFYGYNIGTQTCLSYSNKKHDSCYLDKQGYAS
jgi:hypothetical protein